MTDREKEIYEIAKHKDSDSYFGFIDGARWADANPINNDKYPFLSNIDTSGGHGSIGESIQTLKWKKMAEELAEAIDWYAKGCPTFSIHSRTMEPILNIGEQKRAKEVLSKFKSMKESYK